MPHRVPRVIHRAAILLKYREPAVRGINEADSYPVPGADPQRGEARANRLSHSR